MSARLLRAALALAFVAGLAAGCSKPADSFGAADASSVMEKKADAASPNTSLAITRNADLELAVERITPVFNATVAACNAAAAEHCVVLESQLATGNRPHAELKLRATPAGIARILATLRSDSGLVSESASAEDLAAPIADVERRLAMRRDYRDSLLALRARGGNDITALMKVNEKLAKVQSELEAASGERAHLQQRVDTETLTIAMAAPDAASQASWQPITRSLHGFGSHLSEAAADAITFIAVLIPWLVVLLPLGWLVRLWWRRRRARA